MTVDRRIIDLYNEYVHTALPRREFMSRLVSIAGSSAAAVAVLPFIEPNYAQARQVEPDDKRLKTEKIEFDGPQGKIKACVAQPRKLKSGAKLPGILVIFVLGFGIPGLRLPGVPSDPFFWGIVALTLIYSAYVSEVYRAGIESVHPSQAAAARSLGLSQLQAMRHVVLPQAVRRVIPPLLNDFIGLQKDTVLVSFIGVVEIFRQTQIRQQATFNFTPYLVTALVFLALTIPLARLTDWLVSRERDRRYAAAVSAQAASARRGRMFGFGR